MAATTTPAVPTDVDDADGHDCFACGTPIVGEPVWDLSGPAILALCSASCDGEG